MEQIELPGSPWVGPCCRLLGERPGIRPEGRPSEVGPEYAANDPHADVAGYIDAFTDVHHTSADDPVDDDANGRAIGTPVRDSFHAPRVAGQGSPTVVCSAGQGDSFFDADIGRPVVRCLSERPVAGRDRAADQRSAGARAALDDKAANVPESKRFQLRSPTRGRRPPRRFRFHSSDNQQHGSIAATDLRAEPVA